MFRNDALLQNYDVSVDGSTDKVRYYVSGNFHDQQGISLDSHFRRYNVRANVEAQVAVSAIVKVEPYFHNSYIITTSPDSHGMITVSKERLSLFKSWLNY